MINPSEQAWIVLKNMNKNVFKHKLKKKYGYKLSGGDTIKFGRVRFVVKKISSDSNYDPNPTLIMKDDEMENQEKANNTEDEFDKFNENENFQEPITTNRQQMEEPENDMNVQKLQKRLTVLQTIPKHSYESSLFFDMMSKPVEDFMSDHSSYEEDAFREDEVVIDKVDKNTEEKVCRICLGTEAEDEDEEGVNPLFAPCICAGTMKFVHLECMKQWVHAKRHSKEGDRVKSYNWKFLE